MSQEEMAGNIRDLVQGIVVTMVDAPDMVKVGYAIHGSYVALQIDAAPSDVGFLIGKDGRTVKSLRTLLGAMGRRDKVRYELNVNEQAGKGR